MNRSIALAVFAILTAAAAHAEKGATLSIRGGSSSEAPQVRSVQRDTADDERISAAANETVELLLADGTSVTLAPGATVLLERYRFDRGSRSGELRMRIESGAVRVVGGALNNSSEISVGLPGGTVALDNAVAMIQVAEGRSNVALIAGRKATIQSSSGTRALESAGTSVAISSTGAIEGNPRRLSVTELQRLANLVNPGLATGVVPNFVVDARALPDSAGEADVAATGDATIVDAPRLAEDQTAKDVKLVPVLADPVTPAGACAGGGCVAGAPNFDLGTSIGVIGNRQTGRTVGATWKREYYPGDAGTTSPGMNSGRPDYLFDGGHRNTTGRIFAADPATPYSLTLTGAGAPMRIGNFFADGATCFGGGTAPCNTSPLITLYNSTLAAGEFNLRGITYRVAGLYSGGADVLDLGGDMQLVFNRGMDDTDFNFHEQLFQIPINYTAPGLLQTRNVRQPISACYDFNNQFPQDGCYEDFGNFANSEANRDAAHDDPNFISNYRGVADGAPYGWFSQFFYQLTKLNPGDPDREGNPVNTYRIRVDFVGTSDYDISTLQAGFHRDEVRNYSSDFGRFCTLNDGTFSGPCVDLAKVLFGEDGGGNPVFNYDIDINGNPVVINFPTDRSNTIVWRDPDSFLAVDASSRLPGDNQRLFYATGSVSGDLAQGTAAQGVTLDRFRISAGLSATQSPGRAFLRPDTLLGITPASLLSSDLLVLNAPYGATVSSPSRVLHYDFASSGNGSAQTSTISVTLGSLEYVTTSNSAQLSGRTVGSTARAGASRYSGSVESALFSTAIGGGNPNLAGTGRVGYLALENYDIDAAPNGGTERTIENGTASETNYALLRFGQVLEGGTSAAPARTSSNGLTGYVAGIAEVTSGGAGGTTISLQPLLSDDFTIATDAIAGSVSASFSAELGAAPATVTLGGASGLSAFTNTKEYAAMTSAAPALGAGVIADADAPNAALVSGAPLVASATTGWTSELSADARTRMGGYRHLQWGFFFGDVALAGGQQAHAHLSSWVAGRASVANAPLPTGTADYSGHVFANVSNGNQTYSAAGTYANQWNFGTRSGTGSMSFDNATYSLQTRMLGLRREGTTVTSDSTTVFEGLISNGAGYIGSLNGNFVAAEGAAASDGLAQRAALMGNFTLGTTRDGNPYRAIGTFGAERTGQ